MSPCCLGVQLGVQLKQKGADKQIQTVSTKNYRFLSTLVLIHSLHPPVERKSLKQLAAALMSSTGQATFSTDNVQLIIGALAEYTKETGINLSNNPFATKLEQLDSPEAILQLLQEREKAFKEYRNDDRRLINCLNPAVKILHRFSGILCEAVGQVSPIGYLVNNIT